MESTINQFRSHDRGVDGAKNQLGRRAALRRAVPLTLLSLFKFLFTLLLCNQSNQLKHFILPCIQAKLYQADEFRGDPLPL
jgi:hypothetical protein